MSVPGTEDQKLQLLNCVSCHTVERIVRSTHDADEFTHLLNRMANYAQVSQPIKPQKRMDPEWAPKPESFRKFAEFLASINLERRGPMGISAEDAAAPDADAPPRCWSLNMTCRGRPIEPHDVILDDSGMAWYSNFGEQLYWPARSENRRAQGIPDAGIEEGLPGRHP